MSESYHDRMIRPPAGVAPPVTYVRERHRLIPIPVGAAATTPRAEPQDSQGADARAKGE